MSTELKEPKNYQLGEAAYNNAYCEHTNWKSLFTGADLPSFKNNKESVQEGWIKSALAIKQTLPEQEQRYCVIQDNDCHWFLLPIEHKEAFYNANENEDWETMEQFQEFRTGGGVEDITFINPKQLENI